ncbi:unnamed protein product, partial [Taenia asiatica]|uniref:SERPIN domain-containing protein n=1 Tax=Taenia asiatica TaxID=60517 RepID=A0A0R3W2Y6_TAEAS
TADGSRIHNYHFNFIIRPKSTVSKSVKVNPVDSLKHRDFNNKYCFGVHAINDITKKSGHSPTTIRFLLTVLVGSKAARGTSADQITQALSTTNSRDVGTECTSLVDSALDEWALLSTAGLSDIPLDRIEEGRLCRFQSAIFVPMDDLTFKAEFQWLITNRMGVVWTQDTRFAIAFLLPLVPHKFVEVEHRFTEGLNYGLFNSSRLHFCSMHVVIPMFRVQTEVDLCKALPFLGMSNPFDSDRADFSGISDVENLHINSGKESAFLQVSRSGIRLLSVGTLSLETNQHQFRHPDLFEVPTLEAPGDVDPKEVHFFLVNQPFAVILIDRESDCVLYQARIKVPEPLSNSTLPATNLQ